MSSNTTQQSGTTTSRRQWLQSLGRWASLAALGALGAELLVRRRQQAGTADCRRELPCRVCALRAGCDLPRARAVQNPATPQKG